MIGAERQPHGELVTAPRHGPGDDAEQPHRGEEQRAEREAGNEHRADALLAQRVADDRRPSDCTSASASRGSMLRTAARDVGKERPRIAARSARRTTACDSPSPRRGRRAAAARPGARRRAAPARRRRRWSSGLVCCPNGIFAPSGLPVGEELPRERARSISASRTPSRPRLGRTCGRRRAACPSPRRSPRACR